MSEKVVFIDDEEHSRFMYSDILQDIYGEDYEISAIAPEDTITTMITKLNQIDNLVSIVIDEKLQVIMGANYLGSELVEAFRVIESKLPIYILTSETGSISSPLGSVEYVIDKNKIGKDEYKSQCTLLMRRHINTYNDIKSNRAIRFDELLKKSITEGLSAEEQVEYDSLDIVRIKPVLSTENSINPVDLVKQQKLVKEIEEQLKQLGVE